VIYTKAKVPFTKKLDRTPNELVINARGAVTRLQEPFSGYGVYTEFDSNAIGDIARKNGLKTVYYADLEKFSVLFGIWRYHRIIVYGE
jgi:hypothetical protein